MQKDYNDKLEKWLRVYTALERQNIKYIPMVWSHWGRAHIVVRRITSRVAKTAAQRHGLDAAAIAKRWRRQLGTILALRQARCAERCLPRQQARHKWCLEGLIGEEGGAGCASACWALVPRALFPFTSSPYLQRYGAVPVLIYACA